MSVTGLTVSLWCHCPAGSLPAWPDHATMNVFLQPGNDRICGPVGACCACCACLARLSTCQQGAGGFHAKHETTALYAALSSLDCFVMLCSGWRLVLYASPMLGTARTCASLCPRGVYRGIAVEHYQAQRWKALQHCWVYSHCQSLGRLVQRYDVLE